MEKNRILLDTITSQFADTLERDFGFKTVDSDKGRWYELTWDEFRSALIQKGADFNACSETDWKEFFMLQQEKVRKLLNSVH